MRGGQEVEQSFVLLIFKFQSLSMGVEIIHSQNTLEDIFIAPQIAFAWFLCMQPGTIIPVLTSV